MKKAIGVIENVKVLQARKKVIQPRMVAWKRGLGLKR